MKRGIMWSKNRVTKVLQTEGEKEKSIEHFPIIIKNHSNIPVPTVLNIRLVLGQLN